MKFTKKNKKNPKTTTKQKTLGQKHCETKKICVGTDLKLTFTEEIPELEYVSTETSKTNNKKD